MIGTCQWRECRRPYQKRHRGSRFCCRSHAMKARMVTKRRYFRCLECSLEKRRRYRAQRFCSRLCCVTYRYRRNPQVREAMLRGRAALRVRQEAMLRARVATMTPWEAFCYGKARARQASWRAKQRTRREAVAA